MVKLLLEAGANKDVRGQVRSRGLRFGKARSAHQMRARDARLLTVSDVTGAPWVGVLLSVLSLAQRAQWCRTRTASQSGVLLCAKSPAARLTPLSPRTPYEWRKFPEGKPSARFPAS